MSMCRQLMTFLTEVAFVAHVLFGCCWHDSGKCALPERVTSSASSSPIGCCKHRHCAEGKEKGDSPAGPCKLHCRGICVYVSPQKSQVDAPQIDLRVDFAAVVVLLADNDSHAASDVCSGADDPLDSEPSVRLHLLHQIFLI